MTEFTTPFQPNFKLESTDGKARVGSLQLAHGLVKTPVFMPVGTVGTVKTLTPLDLSEAKTQIILGNTYHLFLRPGLEVIRHFGGLHKFMSWSGPILTDSGGFQIFSLGKYNKIDDQGVKFRSHLDGTSFYLTPQLAVEIQETIGSDIHMVLDECTAFPVTFEKAQTSMRRSMKWAKVCRDSKVKSELCQFGIVQGGMFEDLRAESIAALQEINFEGYAIGGLSVGEPKEDMLRISKYCCDRLPEDKPRYLMGVGTPLDLLENIACGVDMFDCVMPTRNGRNGTVFTSTGRVNIKNEKYKLLDEPLDAECECYTCKTFSKGYLRHLFASGEVLSLRALSLHNVTYYLDLMQKARAAITEKKFNLLLEHHRILWNQPTKL